SSGQLHYAVNGGAYTTIAMTETSPNDYDAVLPAFPCSSLVEFFVSAEEAVEGRYYDPADTSQPHFAIVAAAQSMVFEDDFETDKGWIGQGLWGRGTPTGGGGDHGGPDPSAAFEGSNVYGYNLNGDYEAGLDETHLTSPAFDCSGGFGTRLRFMRWLGVEKPLYDHAYIKVSTDGVNWTIVWENAVEVYDGAWVPVEYDLSSIVDGHTTVYLRFTMGEADSYWEYCGWNIDNLSIASYECEAGPDGDGDGIADVIDNCELVYNPLQEDADGDDIGDVCDDCTDTDADGYGNPGYAENTCSVDNCPDTSNADQTDSSGDGVGDACCCIGTRGNVQLVPSCNPADQGVDVGDLTNLIDHLFITFTPVCCPAEADIVFEPGPGPVVIDVGDLTAMIDHFFINFPPLVDCP
ncbi:MAG: hypothetical protein KKA42_08180, partial [candidate division Zixibacteria bacterium]|nr:hypothetical protein [candidate division Zixibacteria bacterium]